jgi:ATP-dependent DNA helicase RecG
VTKDEDVIVDARQRAAQVVSQDPDLADHAVLARHIARLLDPEREVFLERG